MATPSLKLMDLPTDVKTLILSYIIRPRDLVNVCLTCKQFHEIAVRQLYNTITLDLGSEADKLLPALLNPRNIGLTHVKNVELYKAEVPDPCGVERQADLAMRMLLEFLPENQLERWSFHPWSSFSADNMALLYKKQKKMKWLEAIALDKRFCGCLLRELKLDSVVENVTKLGLYPDSRDTLDFAHELLKGAKKVTKITLHTNFDSEDIDSPVPPSELNDTPIAHGLLTRTIFSHMLPFDKCTPMNLVDLTMQRVHLRYATNSFCKVIKFQNLQNLRISDCSGADSLLAGLCSSEHLPKCLKTFEFKHDDDGRDCEATTAMEGFLCLVSGVEKLTIDLGNTKRFPTEICITRHARTLKLLNVHANSAKSTDCADEDEHVCEIEAFEKICKACTLLEQLSVAFPPTSITRLPTEDFTAFSNSLGSLPNLITLNITSWPTNISASSRMPRKLYEQLLQGMAQTGFSVSIANAILRAHFTSVTQQQQQQEQQQSTNNANGNLTSTTASQPTPTPAAGADPHTPPDPSTIIITSATVGPSLTTLHPNTSLPTNTLTSNPQSSLFTPHSTSTTTSSSNTETTLFSALPTVTSRLKLIAFGSSDKIHEREDSKNITIFVRGQSVDPLGRGTSPLAVPISWRIRKYVEPRSEVLEFGLMRTVRPPVVRELVAGDDDDGDW